ncbi:molecular chaperone [Clostridium sp. DJ247]|uniref:molecular chaperone n=1 Tax=Clostridium sp. DJ247 TaxID=2726188 RepID=UPI0016261B2F|nr:molecular chaperone [Clostridium sp. DJ247]MBC2580541.1 molecular chaperone [Clostridium sp. DJ247]
MHSYKLNNKINVYKRKYSREELMEMTTMQLKNICLEERIIKGVINNLDREGFIRTILKYRGKEESYLIEDYKEEGFERVEEALKKYLVSKMSNSEVIKIPAKITLYPELGIKKEDMYKVTGEKNIIVESNVLLVNEDNDLCGIFNLIRDDNEEDLYYLVAEKNLKIKKSTTRNYSLLFFNKEHSEYIFRTYYSDIPLPPANLEYYKIPLLELEIKELEETNTVLAIDFGTSNTTAGVYLSSNYVADPCYNDILNHNIELNSINYVRFMDITKKEEGWIEQIPTIVYVANCADSDNIKYYFGYKAQKLMKRNDYICNGSVYQGIKRWVNNYSKIEEVYDSKGNVAQIQRGEIIKAYIKYIIETAEHQFKCKFKNLHISSPVKLKMQFIDMFKEILPEYNIEGENSLDEGIAVLYNTIADQIQKNNFYNGEEYKALIIDCGGGTTDLSSCCFTIEEGHISYKIDINTTYENGDTNFGGNNITYRIMQFMKIVFANYYKTGKTLEIDSIIDVPDSDIFRYVDEKGIKKLYENFEKYYENDEKVIPTRFKEYENRSREEYENVKNNFYFLWEIADNMKKEFFQRTNILRNKFDYDKSEDEKDLIITHLSKWNICVLEKEDFVSVYEFPKVIFNIKEISKLIKGEIYEIVRKFLEDFYESGKLQEYSIIKLTGQSCRIDIFKEALKEFVPGKSIEFKQKKEEAEKVPELKLSCLRGAIRYLNSRKMGDVEVSIKNEVPIIPYSVSAFTYNKEEKMLIYSLEKINKSQGYISRPLRAEEIEFYLKNAEGNLKHKYVYENNFDEYKLSSEEEIREAYGEEISQEDTDTIRNGETRFFVFAHEKSWGFYVVPVGRENHELYMGKKKYFAFENDLSELDFFDGLK